MEYIEYNKQDIQSFKLDKTIVSDGQIAGSCELGIAEIQMINDSNEYSVFKNKWIKTDVGSFYVYEVKPVQEKINIKLSCYDIRYLLEVVYDKTKYESLFPCSIATWVNKIATDLGITINNVSDAPNINYVLNEHPYVEENTSYRIVLKQIAQACCSAIDTDLNDNLYFRWFSNKEHIIEDWFNLTSEKEYSVPINAVVLGRGNVEDLVVYPNPVPNNAKEFRIDNNYILDPQNTESDTDRRNEVIAPIYNRVNGLSYLIFNITTEDLIDSLNYNLGEKVKYTDMWGNEISTYGMTITYEWLSGDLSNSSNYKVTLSSSELNETSSEYNYASNVLNDFNKVAFNVDKQNKVIQGIIQTQEENSSKISSLEIKDNEITSKVTSVENGLKTTNQNVSSLQASLDNVSADFEDFKDNEFINSIGNLQDQIDGAIQFWNGEEIPTINNYPANEWTTEEERNNHRADIYTVIEDVDGELKQGKAYRFDKVDNTWQWIELTDNELSAVQAIAQEALDKSNKNIGDIQELVKKTSELSVKDEEITASVEEINNKYEQDITLSKQANGNPVVVTDAGPYKLESLKIEGKSYQETRNGKNLYMPKKVNYTVEGVSYSYNLDGTINLSGTANAVIYITNDVNLNNTKFVDGETYTISINKTIPNGITFKIELYGNSYLREYSVSNNTNPKTFTINLTDVTRVRYITQINKDVNVEVSNIGIQVEKGSTPTEFEQYGASPSPEYPSEIKNVEGVTNYFDYSLGENGFINDSGVVTSRQTQFASDYIPCNSGEDWVIGANDTFSNIGIAYFDKDKNIILPRYDNVDKKEITITIPEGVSYFRVWFNKNYSVLLDGNILKNTYQAQIQKGEFIKGYFPYGRWLETRTQSNDNIFNKNNAKLGYYMSTSGNLTEGDANWYYEKIEVKSNTIYNVSGVKSANSTIGIAEFDENNTFIKQGLPYKNGSFKTSNRTKFIGVSCRVAELNNFNINKVNFALVDMNKDNLCNGVSQNYYINSACNIVGKNTGDTGLAILTNGATKMTISTQIVQTRFRVACVNELPTTSTGISAYNGLNHDGKNQSMTIDTTNYKYLIVNAADLSAIKIYEGIEVEIDDYYRLASIGDTKDTFKDGVLTQRIGKVVLDGSENWALAERTGTSNGVFYLQNYLTTYGLVADTSYSNYGTYYNGYSNQVGRFDIHYGQIRFYAYSSTATIDDWKNMLASNNLIVYGILATPIEHNLNYEILELHEGYNNITTNDELEPNMEITYLTDSKLNAKYATKGELKVTADNIKSEINSTLENGYTTIEQTNKIEQKITDTENEILLEVGKKVTTADYNKDKENLQNDIDSKVSEEKFTKAQIIAKINDKTSQIQINADSIDLNGVVTANENFKINKDGSMTAKAGVFGAWNIDDNGNMYADRKVNGKIYRTYIQQANEEDGGETWAFSTQVSEDDGESFKMTSYISNDGKIISDDLIYSYQNIIGEGLVGGNHLTAYNYEFDPSYIIPLYGQNIQSESFSIPSDKSTGVLGLVLEPGRYLVVSQFKFSTNANGYRAVNIATSAGATDINVTQQAPSDVQTRIRHVAWLAPNSETTYYWNLRQNSGSTLTGDVWVQLYRVQ